MKHPELKEDEYLRVEESRDYKEFTDNLEDYIAKVATFFEVRKLI